MKGFNHLTIQQIASDEEAFNAYIAKYGGDRTNVRPPSVENVLEAKKIATIIQNLYELD